MPIYTGVTMWLYYCITVNTLSVFLCILNRTDCLCYLAKQYAQSWLCTKCIGHHTSSAYCCCHCFWFKYFIVVFTELFFNTGFKQSNISAVSFFRKSLYSGRQTNSVSQSRMRMQRRCSSVTVRSSTSVWPAVRQPQLKTTVTHHRTSHLYTILSKQTSPLHH